MRIGLDAAPLVRAGRLSAKVDSTAVQDGFQIEAPRRLARLPESGNVAASASAGP